MNINSQVKPETTNGAQESGASRSNVDANNNNEQQGAPAAAEPQRAPPQPAANVANDGLGDREDDWLGTLHNIVSFLVLFSIIYYYSSLERFLVIFSIVLTLIL